VGIDDEESKGCRGWRELIRKHKCKLVVRRRRENVCWSCKKRTEKMCLSCKKEKRGV